METPELNDLKPQTAKESFIEKIKAKYPDRDYSDPDEVYNASMEGYDADHERLKSLDSANLSIVEKMEKDPKAAAALAEFLSGKPLPVALRKYFDEDELSMNEGDEKYLEYIQAIKDREAREATNKQMQAQYMDNIEKSEANIESFCSEKAMDPEQFDDFIKKAQEKIISPLLEGNISTELLDILFKGINYEVDMEEALEAGRVAGRNEKIVTSRKTQRGDGLPVIGAGKPTARSSEENHTSRAFDRFAENAQDDIFTRGGYKKK